MVPINSTIRGGGDADADEKTPMKMDAGKSALRAELEEELNPSRKPLHKLFKLFNLITIAVSVLMASGQCVGVLFEDLGIIDYLLRVYILLFCLLVVLNETEFYSLTRDSKLLRIWIFRGAFYSFIGILGMNETAAGFATRLEDGDDDHVAGVLHFIYVASLAMIVIGFIYGAMGLLCLQLIYNRLEDDYRERVKRSKEVRRTTQRYGGIGHDVV